MNIIAGYPAQAVQSKMSSQSNVGVYALFRSPEARVATVTIIFMLSVFLMGGGARSDIASLPLLRGLSLLFAFWAASAMSKDDWRRVRVPVALLIAATLWMIIQLIPLPAAAWQNLPGREAVVEIDRLLGQPQIWRPISLTPSQTWNSLLAMTVPFAALFLAAKVAPIHYPRIMFALVAIACASALLGVLQVLSGPSSAAYFYRITNSHAMAGLFANRNHHAVFLACIVPIVGMLLRDEMMRKRKRDVVRGALILTGILLVVVIVLIGSRAGLIAGIVAAAISYMMVAATWQRGRHAESRDLRATSWAARLRVKQVLLFLPPLLLALLLGGALLLSDRITAATRLATTDIGDDLRVGAWPTVQSLAETHWLLGSGFGSFPEVYKMVEPDALLQESYFNHAHNDWAELVLTGGLPSMAIILFAVAWMIRRILSRGGRNIIKGYRGDIRLAVLIVIALLAGASVVDYPLRVPSIQVTAILLAIFVCCPKSAEVR